GTNANAALWINYRGYADGNTQFRDLYVGNGKGGSTAFFQGSTGNVGIGSASPGYKLDVVGTGQFSQPVIVGTPTAASHATTKSYVDSMFTGSGQWTTSGTNIYSSLAGNVGIGSTSPAAKLDVTGGIQAATSAGTAMFTGRQMGGSYSYGDGIFKAITDNSTGSSNYYFQGVTGGVAGTTNFSVRADGQGYFAGNVGIGTTGPNYKLSVVGGSIIVDSSDGYVIGGSDSTANIRTGFFKQSGLLGPAIASANQDMTFGITNTNTLVPTASATFSEKMRISTTGNVGIGTTGPLANLQIGSATFTGAYGSYNDTRPGLIVGEGAGESGLVSLQISSTYNDATYPNYGLVLVNGPNTTSYDTWGIMHDGPAKATGGLQFAYAAQGSNIHGTTPMVTFQKSGNVGIGSASPGYKLDVSGTGQFSQPVIVGTPTATGHAVTKNYMDSAIQAIGGQGSYYKRGEKTATVTNTWTTVLSVVMPSDHRSARLRLWFGGNDWSSHSAPSFTMEAFLKDGAGSWGEPGSIRQTTFWGPGSDDYIGAQLTFTAPSTVNIQLRTVDKNGDGFSGATSSTGSQTVTYEIDGPISSAN
ncbi:MAG: hypothetical protein HY978_00560, partial [Candidatus Liptonbacteria bacterium]|nr:hypothetical protein [Candidatus Liptonbacteria bacterium]